MDAMHGSQEGFIAGTLVLTQEGQVKIEELRVGDMVRVEDQNGEDAWQPIVQVFTLADKPIREVLYFVDDGSDEQLPIYATDGIAVLTAEFGWTRLDEADLYLTVQLVDRLEAVIVLSQHVLRTTSPGIGYVAVDENMNEERLLDFRNEAVETNDVQEFVPTDGGDPRLRVAVHGFELAADHSFYVGHRNVLVRDSL